MPPASTQAATVRGAAPSVPPSHSLHTRTAHKKQSARALLAQQPADPVDLLVQLAALGRELPLLLLGDRVREAREPLVELHPLLRDIPLFVHELHQPCPQFSFVHAVSFTS